MKKSKNSISSWLDHHGDTKIEKNVERNLIITEIINFDEYIEDVKSQLDENATDFHKNNYVTYTYSNELVDANLVYFEDCMNKGLSAYKALLFFTDYLNNKD
jgi:hypothetical protein